MKVTSVRVIPRLLMEPAEIVIELDHGPSIAVPLCEDPTAFARALSAASSELKTRLRAIGSTHLGG